MKFKKLVLNDSKTKPLEKEFLENLKNYSDEIKVVYAPRQYATVLKSYHMVGVEALIDRMRLPEDYSTDLIQKCSSLKYIGSMHTDIGHWNLKLLKERGISLCNVPGYATEAVAELTIAVLVNISRKVSSALNFVKNGNWGFERFMGWELKGKTLGIIGLGNIGLRVAEIALGFGMDVIYYSRERKSSAELKGVRYSDLTELLKKSDIVSLHCALTDATRNILNKSRLYLMKQDAVLLNPSRSELVDIDTFYDLCKQKKIYAWFDAIEEPKVRAKFYILDNVYLTPHYGWMTKEAQRRLREVTVENIKAFLEGKPSNKIV